MISRKSSAGAARIYLRLSALAAAILLPTLLAMGFLLWHLLLYGPPQGDGAQSMYYVISWAALVLSLLLFNLCFRFDTLMLSAWPLLSKPRQRLALKAKKYLYLPGIFLLLLALPIWALLIVLGYLGWPKGTLLALMLPLSSLALLWCFLAFMVPEASEKPAEQPPASAASAAPEDRGEASARLRRFFWLLTFAAPGPFLALALTFILLEAGVPLLGQLELYWATIPWLFLVPGVLTLALLWLWNQKHLGAYGRLFGSKKLHLARSLAKLMPIVVRLLGALNLGVLLWVLFISSDLRMLLLALLSLLLAAWTLAYMSKAVLSRDAAWNALFWSPWLIAEDALSGENKRKRGELRQEKPEGPG